MDKKRFLTGMGLLVSFALFLTACSEPIMVGSKPGIIGFNADFQPAVSEHYPSSPREERSAGESPGLREIQVEAVIVDLGAGSSTPAVKISGALPEACSQLAEIKQTTREDTFEIRLFAAPGNPACPSGGPGPSFGIDIPLNMAEMPAGAYTVRVNGKEASFEWND